MTEIGEVSLLAAMLVSIYTIVVSFIGGRNGNQGMIASGEAGFFTMLGLLSIASIVLMNAFISHDFSIQYVYNYSSKDLAPFYLVSAFWAGQKGSLLLWAWMLSLFGTIAIVQNRRHNRKLMPYVTAITASTLSLFIMLMVFSVPVFSQMPVIPEDGFGLNPMLQNPGMVFHPPTLFIGYVAFNIPFAFAMAALLSGTTGDVWIRSTRRWTMFAWFFLTMGNMLGANWAYVELGWGGYWAWDPVENASFMPWLIGTAFLHSVMIQEKRDMLKIWNVSLVTATFALTIFGTFITRSGLISSVHAFGRTTVGYYFFAYLLIIIVFSSTLIYRKRAMLASKNQLDSLASRESSFLFNNLMLVGAAFAIFWGTLFPMLSELVTGTKITVGPPFFNKVMVPIGFGLLLLTGLCPLIPWRKASKQRLKSNFLIPLGVAAIGGTILFLLGVRHGVSWLFFTTAIFVLTTIVLEFARGAKARAKSTGDNPLLALYKLVTKNKRRYGGHTIHVGMVCAFIGFAGTPFNQDVEIAVKVGDSFTIKDYKLTYYGYTYSKPTPTKDEIVATILVEKDGKEIGFMQPEKNFYANQNMPNSEVAIHSTLKEDLYVIFAALNKNEVATFKVHINPLVKWIWVGGGVMFFGTLLVIWRDPREEKRFKARYGEA